MIKPRTQTILYSNALALNNPANSFSGNGAGLTGLNAAQLTTGTVPDARLSANVALLSGSADFAAVSPMAASCQAEVGHVVAREKRGTLLTVACQHRADGNNED